MPQICLFMLTGSQDSHILIVIYAGKGWKIDLESILRPGMGPVLVGMSSACVKYIMAVFEVVSPRRRFR